VPETVPEQATHGAGACALCGKQSDTLYSLSGKRLCPSCYASQGGTPPEGSPSMFGQIVKIAGRALGMRQEPKLLKREEPGGQEIVFDLRSRKMVERREGVEAESPLREGVREEKIRKASGKSKKSFFGLLGGKRE
jgi:hypothetical protein